MSDPDSGSDSGPGDRRSGRDAAGADRPAAADADRPADSGVDPSVDASDGDRAAGDPTTDDPDGRSRNAPAVAVVDAETPGNVGTIARSMKNFGFSELLLVDPPPLDPDGEAYGFAGHAREDVLPGAREVDFDYLVENYHTVGTTAITNEDATKHRRFPFATPRELAADLATVDAPVALVFGREGTGLSNDEIARLDRVCSIPASDDYPVLNLGQAATIVLYELRELALADSETQLPSVEVERADEAAIERCYDRFDALLAAVDHPEEKRAKAGRLIRRVLGRAHPTDREVVTLTGIFRRAGELAAGAPTGGDLPAEGTVDDHEGDDPTGDPADGNPATDGDPTVDGPTTGGAAIDGDENEGGDPPDDA